MTAGPGKGQVRQLSKGRLLIGSSPECGVCLDDRKVSRRHVEIEVLASGLAVRDLGSKNGTFLDRCRVEAIKLPHQGAVLTLGDSEITVWPHVDADAAGTTMATDRCHALLGASSVMRALFDRIERAAATRATVLVHGETGTGKQLVAQAIHHLGERAARPFVVVDCDASQGELIEGGAFVTADGGTLLLDDIGALELALQPKLLRVLEQGTVQPAGGDGEQTVDVRVVAASVHDLAEEVTAGRFRADLYYRLAVVCLEIPPLRARREDIPLLVDQFVRHLGAPPPSPQTLEQLCNHSWPGNVRELREVIERAAKGSSGDTLVIDPVDAAAFADVTAPTVTGARPYKDAKQEVVEAFTREYLEALLARHNGNLSGAAREAGVARNWITTLARRYGLKTR